MRRSDLKLSRERETHKTPQSLSVIVYRGRGPIEPRFCKNRLDKSYSLWYCRVDESGQAIERQS